MEAGTESIFRVRVTDGKLAIAVGWHRRAVFFPRPYDHKSIVCQEFDRIRRIIRAEQRRLGLRMSSAIAAHDFD